MTEETFSIDHVIPWLHNSIELFWDIDNIAFSHQSCNGLARRFSLLRRMGNPEESWCYKCKAFKSNKEFYTDPNRWNGFMSRCKTHDKAEKRSRLVE